MGQTFRPRLEPESQAVGARIGSCKKGAVLTTGHRLGAPERHARRLTDDVVPPVFESCGPLRIEAGLDGHTPSATPGPARPVERLLEGIEPPCAEVLEDLKLSLGLEETADDAQGDPCPVGRDGE